LSPSEKIEFLEKLLLSSYNIDKIKNNLKDKITETKNEYISCESKMNTLKDVLKKMELLEEKDVFVDKIKINSENVQKIREKVLNNFDICEKNIKTLKNKIKKLEDEKTSFLNIIEKRNNAIFFIEKLREEYKEYNDYYEDKEKINDLLKELKKHIQIKDDYIKYKTYNEYLLKKNELKIKYDHVKKENEDKKQIVLKELHLLEKPNKERVIELEKNVQIIDKLMDIDDELNSLDYDEENVNMFIKTETKNLEDMKEKLILAQKLLSEIDKCYTCPSCKKKLKIKENKLIEYVEYENCDFNNSNLKKDIQIMKTDIIIKEKSLTELKNKQIDYNQKNKEYNNLFSKLTGEFNNDKDSILNEIDRLTKNNKLYDELLRKTTLLENDTLEKQLKKEYEFYENNKKYEEYKEYKEYKEKDYIYSLEQITIINEKISIIKTFVSKIETLKKDLENMPEIVNKDFDDIVTNEKNKLSSYEEKVKLYKEYSENITYWIQTFDNNKKYKDIEQEIIDSQNTSKELMDKTRCLSKFREYVKIAEKKAITDFIDSLNEHASIYIEQFFPDEDIRVELKTTQETKSTGKEKISLNFELQYRQLIGDLSFLSGGEKDRVNLAFTLAFSEMINNRILLLDECISSLDTETTNIVLENIKEKYKGKLVILVSHQANLGFFDKIIDV
jgi:DNA repair exonuclease SbcCD ATPase subunit